MDNVNVIDGKAVPVNTMNLAMLFRVPAVRQLLLLIGVSLAVAAGFVVASWSQQPAMTMLYTNIGTAEAADIVSALRASNIDYELDTRTGDILVPESRLHDARLQLASQGFGDAATAGMDGLNEQSSFGTSQFMETARYQHALEAELARTIASLGAVREARVHLALPKRTAFLRDQKASSASVLLHLYRGQSLEADQAAAIVNLVAASVPDLTPGNVTLVDQFGSLLSSSGQQLSDAQATSQFKYTRRLEETYKRRIEDLLTPLLGPGRIRAEVVADIDFTYVEETRESFDPNRTVVRSERLDEDLRTGGGNAASGVPGALSNQPPEAGGIAPEDETATDDVQPKNTSRSSVRNYEVDRTISHTRPQSNTIRRLSVAVLVDESPVGDAAEARTLSDQELERYTAVVKEAVGFNEARGDTVVVLGQAFLRVEDAIDVEAPPIWQQPFVKDAAKQVIGALIVLAIAFGVVRPMLRSVVASSAAAPISGEYLGGGHVGPMPGAAAANDPTSGPVAMPNYNEKVAAAKNLTGHDPARVAQVVKQWVATNE